MTTKPSAHDNILTKKESRMEKRSQELIKQLKEIRALNPKITCNDIQRQTEIDAKEANYEFVPPSLTTVRRVFSKSAESKASSFKYETTLLPIRDALQKLAKTASQDDSPYAEKIRGLEAVIAVQNEELDRIMEIKEHLDNRVNYLIEQGNLKDSWIKEKDDIIKRIMDRNDRKDQTINEITEENKKLNESLRLLMDRCRMCDKRTSNN